MQILIDIPEEIYDRCREYRLRCGEAEVLEGAVANGMLLPKEHGRLVDEKDLSLMTVHLIDGIFVCTAPTIIEAEEVER